jgi:hypothetical protein
VDEVVAKVMLGNKVAKLFQIVAIMSLNTGNLNLEVSNLKNKLATKEKGKAILQVELDKERGFQRGYKHNIEIWRENRIDNEQKIKVFI